MMVDVGVIGTYGRSF